MTGEIDIDIVIHVCKIDPDKLSDLLKNLQGFGCAINIRVDHEQCRRVLK